MNINLLDYVIQSKQRKSLIFGTNVGASIIRKTLPVVYTDENAQIDAINAFCEFFKPDFVTTSMDLSIEAECFGSQVKFLGDSAPVVTGRLITDTAQINNISIPEIGVKRTEFCLNILQKIISDKPNIPVIAGTIGPFSLAGRLFGVTEILELVILDPESAIKLIEKCNLFIENYIRVIKSLGADGVLLAEPTAGLLSPRQLGKFSSNFIKELVEKLDSPGFRIIYHNCAAALPHLPQIIDSGVSIMHFGEPMDIPLSLSKVPPDRIISGNLDPAKVFLLGSHALMENSTKELLSRADNYPNFLISP
jgi:uroporphyrinogen decarboxylase